MRDPLTAVVRAGPMTVPLANAIRRTLLTDVATVSAANVTFSCNESVMPDKQLAHRIGLLVYEAEADEVFELDATGPECGYSFVTAASLRAKGSGRVVTDAVPLVMLRAGARLRCTVTMRRGTGGEDARFSPVEVVEFRPAEGAVSLALHPTGALASAEALAEARRSLLSRIRSVREEAAGL